MLKHIVPGILTPIICAAAFLIGSVPGRAATSAARTLLNENRLDEAVTVCRQFELLSSIDADNHLACAWVYLRTDRLDGAQRFIERARKSGLGAGELELLNIYSDIKQKRYEQARLNLNRSAENLRNTPLYPTVQELSAELYELIGQSDTAAFIYKQIATEDPSRARAHWGLGRYYLSRGDVARAKSHLQTATKLWPRHIGSRYNLAVVLLQSNEVEEAARVLGQCYKVSKTDPGVLEQLGVVLEKRGNLAEAIKFWRKAVSISADASLAREKLASYGVGAVDALIDAGQYEQALAQLDSMGKAVSKAPPFQLRRAIIFRYLQRYDQAVSILTPYVQANSKDSVGQRELGICLTNLRKWERAAAAFERAIEADPSSGLNHAWVAYVYEVRKKFPDARAHWSTAVRLLTDPADLARAKRRLASLDARGSAHGPTQGAAAREGTEEIESGPDAHTEHPSPNEVSAPVRGMWESPSPGVQLPQ